MPQIHSLVHPLIAIYAIGWRQGQRSRLDRLEMRSLLSPTLLACRLLLMILSDDKSDENDDEDGYGDDDNSEGKVMVIKMMMMMVIMMMMMSRMIASHLVIPYDEP